MSMESKDNLANSLVELLEKFLEEIKDNPMKIESEFEYPMEISGIKNFLSKNINTKKTGLLVRVRPCADEYKDKTFLGIYIGDIIVEAILGLYTKTNILSIINRTNPAIFVLELNKVIFGYESWWGEIKSEEQLKEITDNDINNVWYVKALKQLSEKTDGMGTRTENNKVSQQDKE